MILSKWYIVSVRFCQPASADPTHSSQWSSHKKLMKARYWCAWENVGYAILYTFALCGLAADAVSAFSTERGTEPTL